MPPLFRSNIKSSSRMLMVGAAFAATLAISGCASTTATNGFQVVEAKPTDIKVNEDTKSTVLERLGSPSLVSTFEPNVWFYVSQATEKKAFFRPRVTDREVVAITFDKASEKVLSVNDYELADGKQVAFAERETPTRGREMSILEQLLGNVGRVSSVLGQNEDERVPGGRRRE